MKPWRGSAVSSLFLRESPCSRALGSIISHIETLGLLQFSEIISNMRFRCQILRGEYPSIYIYGLQIPNKEAFEVTAVSDWLQFGGIISSMEFGFQLLMLWVCFQFQLVSALGIIPNSSRVPKGDFPRRSVCIVNNVMWTWHVSNIFPWINTLYERIQ